MVPRAFRATSDYPPEGQILFNRGPASIAAMSSSFHLCQRIERAVRGNRTGIVSASVGGDKEQLESVRETDAISREQAALQHLKPSLPKVQMLLLNAKVHLQANI